MPQSPKMTDHSAMVSEEMIEAGVRAWLNAGGHDADSTDLVGPIYLAMRHAESIPDVSEVLMTTQSEKLKPFKGVAYFWPVPWSSTRPEDEEMVQILDAHGRTIARLEWPFHSEDEDEAAELATYALADRIAEISTRPLSMTGEGWQPIETAPRDATPKLLTGLEWSWPRTGFWSDWNEYWTDGRTDRRSGTFVELLRPTHWQPLPEPPAAIQEQGE